MKPITIEVTGDQCRITVGGEEVGTIERATSADLAEALHDCWTIAERRPGWDDHLPDDADPAIVAVRKLRRDYENAAESCRRLQAVAERLASDLRWAVAHASAIATPGTPERREEEATLTRLLHEFPPEGMVAL